MLSKDNTGRRLVLTTHNGLAHRYRPWFGTRDHFEITLLIVASLPLSFTNGRQGTKMAPDVVRIVSGSAVLPTFARVGRRWNSTAIGRIPVFRQGVVSATVWSKLGVSPVSWRDLHGARVRQTSINTGERNGRHEGTRTPDLYRVKVAL